MTGCGDCAQAAGQPWDCYTAACAGCQKRMLATMAEAIAPRDAGHQEAAA